MSTHLTDADKRQQLQKLITGFDTAMLVTRTSTGGLRSRPLSIADNRSDGLLYFATSVESGKVQELDADPRVNVTIQDGKRQFISVTGTARIEKNRALVDELWTEAWKVWFPKGKDDPTLCLVIVQPSEAEYWDVSGTKGLRYFFEAAKAYVTGTKADEDDERQNAKVPLQKNGSRNASGNANRKTPVGSSNVVGSPDLIDDRRPGLTSRGSKRA